MNFWHRFGWFTVILAAPCTAIRMTEWGKMLCADIFLTASDILYIIYGREARFFIFLHYQFPIIDWLTILTSFVYRNAKIKDLLLFRFYFLFVFVSLFPSSSPCSDLKTISSIFQAKLCNKSMKTTLLIM